jgi:cell pole-organizing protein PopZ
MAKNTETAPKEPAMSQVLNDIRDVIVSDNPPPTPSSAPAAEAPTEEVLELTEIVEDNAEDGQAQDVIASIDNAITGKEGVEATVPVEEKEASPVVQAAVTPPAAPASAQPRAAMISAEAASSASAALRSLVNIASEQTGLQFRSGNTLEDLVVEALKPELVTWLDRHLPGIVQEIVEREIQRLIPVAKK